jgi:hypothetical protein
MVQSPFTAEQQQPHSTATQQGIAPVAASHMMPLQQQQQQQHHPHQQQQQQQRQVPPQMTQQQTSHSGGGEAYDIIADLRKQCGVTNGAGN